MNSIDTVFKFEVFKNKNYVKESLKFVTLSKNVTAIELSDYFKNDL
jgi:hypothetical protein